jgi:S-formylglutathione hydrolase FrmB
VRIKIIATAALLFAALAGESAVQAAQSVISLSNSSGIQVNDSNWVNPRLLDVRVSTAALSNPAGVRVLLPNGYSANSTARYPVLYLLHGGGGVYTDWTTYGNVDEVTTNLPVIVVMFDGGKGSWYSDFDNFGLGGTPRWETFSMTQVLPWVDANFRTIATRNGRAIAGLSMGGYGAMSYAARHPDLFVSASSFSGAVDTSIPAFNAYIAVSPVIDGGLPGSIWGVPPFDMPGLLAHNPTTLVKNLRGMHIGMYTGNGQQGPLDGPFNLVGVFNNIQEGVVEQMNLSLDRALTKEGIPHTLNDYGNGTHAWAYWNRDFKQEMPAIMAAFANPAAPGNAVPDADFEGAGNGPWVCSASCGVDHGLGNARTGSANGWARGWTGWTDINQTLQVAANTNYRLTGWVRTSANSNNGYFGVRTTGGTVIGERNFARLNGYTQITVNLNTGNNTQVVVYGGVWTNWGDTWMQIDDVALTPGN